MSPKLPLLIAVAANIIMMIAGMKANSAVAPNPPPQLCAGAICASASAVAATSSTATAVKWHPGHYVIPNARPNNTGNFSTTQAAINDMDNAFVSSSERFMGLQLEPTWYQLETPAGGHYYFNPADPNYVSGNVIDQALSALATKSASRSAACGCTVDYKLIIFLPGLDSVSNTLPTTPQAAPYGSGASNRSISPDYVLNAGCAFVDANGQVALRLWQSACMTPFINLVNALGAVYDNNPHVEMIIPIYETAVNSSKSCDATYSVANLTSQLQNLATAMATSWPTTQKIIFANYGYVLGSTAAGCTTIAMTNAQVDTLVANWISNTSPHSNNGFGMGGPDILYQSDDGAPTTGDQISRGLIGSVSYLGKVGLAWEEQANPGGWNDQTSSGTESYAYGTLGATHEIWADIPSGQTSNPSGEWPAIIAALDAVSFRINSTRPTSYH
jgi:hypothetical protein